MKLHNHTWTANIILIGAIILSICVFIFGCSPQKRMNRLIDKYPDLVQADTLRDTIQVIVPEVKVDTFISLDSLKDTVIITEDRLKIKTVIRNNEIYIEGECETDTIYQKVEIPIEKVVYLEDTPWTDFKKFVFRWWKWLLALTVVVIALRFSKAIISKLGL